MRQLVAGSAFGEVHQLAEGPRWDDLRTTVSWVDIARGRVFEGTLDGDGIRVTRRFGFRDTVGAAAPTADGGYAVAAHDRVVVVAADGTRQASAPLIERDDRLRLNDAAVDPAGRLLVGSIASDKRTGAASLFSLGPDGTTTVLRSRLNLANGIGWSPDGATLYFADSVPGTLWSASYEVAAGEVHTWAPLVTRFDGAPDGLCVDSDGRIWVALWNGSQVLCFEPSGEAVAQVLLPVPHVTAVAFVGPARDRLLITSARDELDAAARERYPDSGRMFLADVGAVGLPTSHYRTRENR
jgi:sugar lactone lactonase YvrE